MIIILSNHYLVVVELVLLEKEHRLLLRIPSDIRQRSYTGQGPQRGI